MRSKRREGVAFTRNLQLRKWGLHVSFAHNVAPQGQRRSAQ
jgi:hypothetical protein